MDWITIKGNHVPVREGQTKQEAIKIFLDGKKDPVIEKYNKMSIKELEKVATPKVIGKFSKSGKTTEIIPDIKKGEYKGTDKYPKTTNSYKFEKNKEINYIEIDLSTDIQKKFNNADKKERTKIAREYILNNLRGKYLSINDIEINISRKTAKEIVNTAFEPKIRVSPELVKIITLSYFVETKKATHGTFNRFLYYKTYLSIGKEKYSAILNVGVDRLNNCTLYDINQFKKQ